MIHVRCVLGLVAVLSMNGCTPKSNKTQPEDAAIPPSSDGSAGSPNGGAGGAGGMIQGAAGTDAGVADGSADGGFVIPGLRPDLFNGPTLLSEAGLYSDVAHGVLADGVEEYQPLGVLWADEAEKTRWIKLPPGGVIDTSDMDDWSFPTDTRVFKEFVVNGKRIETRMVWKRGPADFPMVAYIWNPEQTEAYAAPNGLNNADGTPHDVPDATKCPTCHNGRADRFLGPTALQLSHTGTGVTIDTLISQNRLSKPPATPITLPGDAATQAALAYLHANCGNCHNPKSLSADRQISVYFWQNVDSLATLQDTVTYKSLVTDKASPLWINAVLDRMGNRGGTEQMPPVATEEVDVAGMATVKVLMDRLLQDVPALPKPAAGGNCPGTDAVLPIFATACTSNFCHGTGSGGLFLSSTETAQQLLDATVGVAAQGPACGNVGLSRVEPGHPERSLLWLKLRPGPPCGITMAPNLSLTDAQITAVGNWISGCTATP